MLSVLLAGSTTQAQWYNPAGCGCAPQVCQPICQPAYQTVPVTEYQQVTETVRRPVYETEYVEQPVTEYRPVTEQRTANVPTVSYQNVTEYRTVQRDYGGWQTNYQPIPRCDPCQYDNRPGITGWINRTAFAVRQSFTPAYTVQRNYIPRVVAQQVPYTRQVAIRGTRQVTYNVTKMVPHQTTRRVAVHKLRYKEEKVTAMRPITVMRSVPIGTRMTYGVSPYATTQTTLAPVPDSVGGARSAAGGSSGPSRTADRDSMFDGDDETVVPGREFRRNPVDSSARDSDTRRGFYETIPKRQQTVSRPARSEPTPKTVPSSPSVAKRTTSLPSIVRVSGWTARSQRSRGSVAGPRLTPPSVSVAEHSQ